MESKLCKCDHEQPAFAENKEPKRPIYVGGWAYCRGCGYLLPEQPKK